MSTVDLVPPVARCTTGLCAVAVVVPARDEEELVGRCLASVVVAVRRLRAARPEVTVRVVLVSDASTDATEAVARAVEGVDVLVVDAGAVGVARAAGVRHALDLLGDPDPAATWLACTDADSVVPADWLLSQVRHAEAGADVVVGTVRPEGLRGRRLVTWARTHVPGRPNGHVHGANLGVRVDAFTAAGGFPAVAEHEDVQLVEGLRASGVRIVASDEAEVLTSGRRIGRTPGGYAAYLAGDPWGA